MQILRPAWIGWHLNSTSMKRFTGVSHRDTCNSLAVNRIAAWCRMQMLPMSQVLAKHLETVKSENSFQDEVKWWNFVIVSKRWFDSENIHPRISEHNKELCAVPRVKKTSFKDNISILTSRNITTYAASSKNRLRRMTSLDGVRWSWLLYVFVCRLTGDLDVHNKHL